MLKRLKTPAAQREVILALPLATLLRERWLASAYKGADAYVFYDSLGRDLDYRDVGAGFRAAVQRAGVSGRGGSRSTPCATASPRS